MGESHLYVVDPDPERIDGRELPARTEAGSDDRLPPATKILIARAIDAYRDPRADQEQLGKPRK